jgi:histidyl-tRNA synthetase
VALRFDLTVPFARFVAENAADLVFPLKKVQVGNSWRGEKPQKGRYREFCQADLDIIGVDSLAADLEVLSCILGNLEVLVPSSFTMSIGHRIILSGLIRACLPAVGVESEGRVLIALDKLAKIGSPAVAELIMQIEGSDTAGVNSLLEILQSHAANGDTDLILVRSKLANQAEALLEVQRLEETVDLLRRILSGEKARARIDLSIARGLGYYTGIVFETTIDGLVGFGSISSGGRYNGLVSRFSSQELPGIGGSIGVDRLLAALEQLGGIEQGPRKGVFIALAGTDARAYGFELLGQLRRSGLVADIALKEGKLGQQFKFADRRHYQFVLTLGSQEVESQTVSIKDLSTGGERKAVPWAEALQKLVAESC